MGYLTQKPFFIADTIKQNICLGMSKDQQDEKKIFEHLQDLQIYDDVKKIQLRIKTQSYILHDKKKIREYWEKVPLVSRQSYSTQLPPSTVIKGEQIDPSNGLSLEEDHNEKSFCNFCVIENYIKEIDFLSLTSSPHKRISITIDNTKIIIQDLIP